MYQRESQASSLADTLGRKEGFEHPIEHVWRNSTAGITHGQPYIGTWDQTAVRQPAILRHVRTIKPDIEYTAILHRLQRIRAEIHRHLV